MKLTNVWLSAALHGRDNNLNLIRFCAATMVLIAHSFTVVTGDATQEPFTSSIQKSIGSIAVDIFFFISGMLITNSLVRNTDYVQYAISRIMRIFPALLVANLLTILILGATFTSGSMVQYLGEGSWLTYLIKNSSLFFGIQYHLSDLFESVPYAGVINGSLWTLPYELKMYLSIALIFAVSSLVRFFTNEIVLLSLVALIAAISFFYLAADIFLPDEIVPYWKGGRLVFMFFLGALIFLCSEKVLLSGRIFFVSIFILLVSMASPDFFLITYLIVAPYIILYLSYVPKGRVREFNRVGDFSYGLYIYAFPIQQTLIFLRPETSISGMIFTAFFVTLGLSVLSWYFVEKPSLSKRNVLYELITKRVFKTNAPSW